MAQTHKHKYTSATRTSRQGKQTSRSSARSYISGTAAVAMQPQQAPHRNPDIRVRQGGGFGNPATMPYEITQLFRALLAVAACIAVVGFLRIFLIIQTVEMSIESNSLDQRIEALHSQNAALEVQHSRLANTAVVREQAKTFGMASPQNVTRVNLADDVVVCDSAGNLSLVGSIEALRARS